MKKYNQNTKKKSDGFTLIEILVVIGIIAVLASVVLVAVNPARQFKLARDSQRVSNVNAILNAISQNISEHKGVWTCNNGATPLPNVITIIASGGIGIDAADCLVPAYISALPFDPSATNARWTSVADYNTGYKVSQDVNGAITVYADGEIAGPISVSR